MPGFNLLTAMVLGIGGYFLGAWIGRVIVDHSTLLTDSQLGTDQNDVSLILGYLVGTIGFLVGLGFADYPLSRLAGRPARLPEKEEGGVGRYFRACTDHKVVGIQYLVGVLFFFFVPILIGAKRMAFPRIEALTFWLVPAAEVILLSAIAIGGFPSGWTGYASLSDQARLGMDAYLMSFALIAISMTLVGLNMLATVYTMRAPGMTWTRLPIFVWGVISTGVLMVLAAPVLVVTMSLVMLDRTAETSFFLPSAGGSTYLYENLFWFFGHPEVYILALPGFGVVALFFNFLIGGLSGIFNSDAPSDVTTHGSFFVMAHFHHTIMGGLVFVFFNLTFFPLFAVGFLGQPRLLYALGGSRRRRAVPARRRAASRDPRVWLFAAALAVSVGALGQPMDRYAGELFWAHMLQHVLLVVAVAPLLVLAAPWNRLWRGVPLRWRRPIARGLVRARWSAPLRTLARGLARPLPAFALYNGVFVAWHVPWLYDAAVDREALHALEHVLFLGLAVLLWTQVIDSPPFRPRLG